MLTVDCQPLQSFARLNECRDQSFWSLENERERKDEESEKGGNGKEGKKRGGKRAKNWQPYKCLNIHITHTQTHTELWTPR